MSAMHHVYDVLKMMGYSEWSLVLFIGHIFIHILIVQYRSTDPM